MIEMDENIQIIVTGANGYLGKRMTRSLENHFKVLKVDLEGICTSRIDLLKEESWNKLEKHVNFPLVFLINSAFIHSPNSKMEKENMILLENLSRFMDKHSNIFLLYPSTALVYGVKYRELITEDFLPKPESLYAKVKFNIERRLLHQFSSRCTIFRMTNIYGNGTGGNTVIGKIFNQLKKNQRISLNDYNSVRDFIEIDNVIDAFIKMILYIVRLDKLSNQKKQSAYNPHSVFNLSTGKGVKIYDLASKFAYHYKKAHLLPEKEKMINCGRNEYLIPSPEKLKQLFVQGESLNLNEKPWQPMSIEEGIKRMIEH